MKFLNFFRRAKPKARESVTFTDDGVRRIRADGLEEAIRWDDLCEVGIITTDGGPFQEDVFLVLVGSDDKSGCVVPQSAEGCERLLERLQQLPGFDNEAVVEAMGSTSNAKFVCWKRQAA